MIDTGSMLDVASIVEGNDGLTKLVEEAKQFLIYFDWCQAIRAQFLYRCEEDLFALFLFEIESSGGAPSQVWVIVGDLSPAVLPPDNCPTGEDAFYAYIYELERWADAVLHEDPLDELMPVLYRGSHREVEPTPEKADLARRRAQLLRECAIRQRRCNNGWTESGWRGC